MFYNKQITIDYRLKAFPQLQQATSQLQQSPSLSQQPHQLQFKSSIVLEPTRFPQSLMQIAAVFFGICALRLNEQRAFHFEE
jgi:hypothetical protein